VGNDRAGDDFAPSAEFGKKSGRHLLHLFYGTSIFANFHACPFVMFVSRSGCCDERIMVGELTYIYIYYIYIHTHTNTRTVVRGILLWLGCAPPCGVENKVLARFFWEKKSSLGHHGANSLVSHP
jgi:3-methyladenine DNA glycosylase Mpg